MGFRFTKIDSTYEERTRINARRARAGWGEWLSASEQGGVRNEIRLFPLISIRGDGGESGIAGKRRDTGRNVEPYFRGKDHKIARSNPEKLSELSVLLD